MTDTTSIDPDKLWEIIGNYSVLINKIQSALGTNECGDNLIEVARNAHKAEMELASWKLKFETYDSDIDEAFKLIKEASDR